MWVNDVVQHDGGNLVKQQAEFLRYFVVGHLGHNIYSGRWQEYQLHF